MPGVTDVWDLPYPSDADPVDVAVDIQRLAEAIDFVLANLTATGTRASRPGTGTYTGQRFIALDIGVEYLWDGTQWVRLGDPAGSMQGLFLNGVSSTSFGWELARGQTVVGAATNSRYLDLWAVWPAAFKSGNDLTFPDLRGRVLRGLDNMGGGDANRMGALPSTAVGAAGGSTLMSIAQMPTHAHAGVTGASDRSLQHQHALGSPGASVTQPTHDNHEHFAPGVVANFARYLVQSSTPGSGSLGMGTGNRDVAEGGLTGSTNTINPGHSHQLVGNTGNGTTPDHLHIMNADGGGQDFADPYLCASIAVRL